MREMIQSNISNFKEIPVDWEITKLKTILSIRNEKNSGDRELLSVYLDKGVISYSDSDGMQVHKPSQDLSNYQNVYVGDFILNNQQAWRGSVGVSKYDGIISPAYFVYKLSEKCYPPYMNYLLRDACMYQQYETASRGVGTIQRNLFAPWLMNCFAIIPPYDEQKLIADFLDRKCSAIDSLTADIEEQITTMEQYKRSIITEAVTKGLDPDAEMKNSGIEWIGDIPEEWETTKIDILYNLRNEKVSDKDYPPLSVTMKGIVPQLESAAKTNDGDNRKLVRKGDFAINSRSDRRGSCGISEYDGSVSLINTVLCPKGSMHPGYYNWLFHSPLFSDEFYRWGHGIVDDLWTTNWQDMKKITLPVPPLSEQALISDFLDKKCAEIDSIIADKKSQLDALAEYKKSLIYEYVTGKKEVPAS